MKESSGPIAWILTTWALKGPWASYSWVVSAWGWYLGVNSSVLIQAHCVSEGFPADPALKRPRPAVRAPNMHLQAVGRGENLWEIKYNKIRNVWRKKKKMF